MVERGRERARVGGDRVRAGAPERRDDVHALPRAGEEHCGHGRRGYPVVLLRRIAAQRNHLALHLRAAAAELFRARRSGRSIRAATARERTASGYVASWNRPAIEVGTGSRLARSSSTAAGE